MTCLGILRAMLFFALFGAAASASALTIEGTIRYWDNRSGGSSDSGSLFSWGQGDRNLPYPHIEIWDYNGSCHDFNDSGCTETDDYKLASVVANSSGRYSWSGLGVNQDPYLVFRYKSDSAQLRHEYGGEFVVAGPEILNVSSNTTVNWNVTCWATYGLTCGSNANVTSNYAVEQHLTGILASAAAVQSRWNFLGMSPNSRATIYFPRSFGYGKCYENGGQAWDYDKACVTTGTSATLTAHEIGHLIHRRKLGYSGNLSDGTCPDGYNWFSPAPSATDPVAPWGVPNKCATSEGWANFVSAATYWASYATTPQYGDSSLRNLEGDTTAGNSGQLRRCVRHGSVNGADASERYIGNVTRFFWDLYDTTTIGDSSPTGHTDTISNSLAEIAQIWDWFPSGTANRANDEAGDDGRNVWDYKYWNNYYSLPSVTGLIYVNCLEDQVP